MKHRIEDMVEQCGGVGEIRNFLSVRTRGMDEASASSSTRSTSTAGRGGTATGVAGSTGTTTGKH